MTSRKLDGRRGNSGAMKINKDQSGRSISWLYVLVSFVLAFFLIKTLAGSSDTTAGARASFKVENPGTGVDLGNQTAPTAMVTELGSPSKARSAPTIKPRSAAPSQITPVSEQSNQQSLFTLGQPDFNVDDVPQFEEPIHIGDLSLDVKNLEDST